MDPKIIPRLSAIRDSALGPLQDRTLSPPSFSEGKLVGGTAYERSRRAVPVHADGRCYKNGMTEQNVCGLVSVTASAKMTSDELDEHQKLQRDINLVSVYTPYTLNVQERSTGVHRRRS